MAVLGSISSTWAGPARKRDVVNESIELPVAMARSGFNLSEYVALGTRAGLAITGAH